MNNNPQPVATSWRVLLARHEPDVRRLIAQDVASASDIEDLDVEDLSTIFAGEDKVLARGILACGTEVILPLVGQLHPVLSKALASLNSFERENSLEPKRILSFALIAECTGIPRPAGFDGGPLTRLVPARDQFSDAERRSMAFLALALSDTAAARGLLDAEPAGA